MISSSLFHINGNSAMIAGLTLGLASVVSIGPNNLMLLREGLVRGRIWTVSTTIFVSFLLLLVVACVTTDWMVYVAPEKRNVVTWLGVFTLAYFAMLSVYAAISVKQSNINSNFQEEKWLACLWRVLTVVWFNPLTYVEYLLIPAAICRNYTSYQARLSFISGLVIMAAASCYAYALGGGLLAPCMRHRKAMQLFDLTSALLLGGVAMVIGTKLIDS